MFCKNCGDVLERDQAMCMNCGVRNGIGNSYCEFCGQAVEPNDEICVSCGCKMTTPEELAREEAQRRRSAPAGKFVRWVPIILGAVAFIISFLLTIPCAIIPFIVSIIMLAISKKLCKSKNITGAFKVIGILLSVLALIGPTLTILLHILAAILVIIVTIIILMCI